MPFVGGFTMTHSSGIDQVGPGGNDVSQNYYGLS